MIFSDDGSSKKSSTEFLVLNRVGFFTPLGGGGSTNWGWTFFVIDVIEFISIRFCVQVR